MNEKQPMLGLPFDFLDSKTIHIRVPALSFKTFD